MYDVSSFFVALCRSVGRGLLLVLLGGGLVGASSAVAQEDDYEEWRKEQRQQYQEYLNEQDEAFLKFLKKQWKNVDVEAEAGSPVDDKPSDIPTVGDLGNEPTEPSSATEPPEPDPAPAPPTNPSDSEDPSPSEDRRAAAEESAPPETDEPAQPRADRPRQEGGANTSTATLSFFGVQTAVPYRGALVPSLRGAPGKESIGDFWETMAKQDYDTTLEAVQAKRDELGLSDWGYYVYLRDLGNRLYEENGRSPNANAATLWTWFMMMQSGYAVRVGYRGDDIFLLLPVDRQIYNRPQMYLNDQRYYLMVEESGGGSLRTYEGQHEEADRVLSLEGHRLPSLEGRSEQRTVSFSYDDERYNIAFRYDTAVLEYLRAYPNVELDVLFQTDASPAAAASLTDALRPHLDGRSPRDQLNILLRFAQFVTKYQTDQENFGEERYLFAEETLAAQASDCEDRAVLFSYLVRSQLDREVVGLRWPSHVATAVKVDDGFEATAEDRTLTIDGETYVMADPTYIGSSLGMEMPLVEGKDPEVIQFAQN